MIDFLHMERREITASGDGEEDNVSHSFSNETVNSNLSNAIRTRNHRSRSVLSQTSEGLAWHGRPKLLAECEGNFL